MPFPDEISPGRVSVLPYQASWAAEADALLTDLGRLVPNAVALEHIGSTSVPGLAAKPCLDLMIVVRDLATSAVEPSLTGAGYRRRPEAWNNAEWAAGRSWPKMVFAPPIGGRRCNIHVRREGTAPVRLALLFRGYLTAHPDKVMLWSEFKLAIAAVAPDLAGYGQLKRPAWTLLMECADVWAAQTQNDLSAR